MIKKTVKVLGSVQPEWGRTSKSDRSNFFLLSSTSTILILGDSFCSLFILSHFFILRSIEVSSSSSHPVDRDPHYGIPCKQITNYLVGSVSFSFFYLPPDKRRVLFRAVKRLDHVFSHLSHLLEPFIVCFAVSFLVVVSLSFFFARSERRLHIVCVLHFFCGMFLRTCGNGFVGALLLWVWNLWNHVPCGMTEDEDLADKYARQCVICMQEWNTLLLAISFLLYCFFFCCFSF